MTVSRINPIYVALFRRVLRYPLLTSNLPPIITLSVNYRSRPLTVNYRSRPLTVNYLSHPVSPLRVHSKRRCSRECLRSCRATMNAGLGLPVTAIEMSMWRLRRRTRSSDIQVGWFRVPVIFRQRDTLAVATTSAIIRVRSNPLTHPGATRAPACRTSPGFGNDGHIRLWRGEVTWRDVERKWIPTRRHSPRQG